MNPADLVKNLDTTEKPGLFVLHRRELDVVSQYDYVKAKLNQDKQLSALIAKTKVYTGTVVTGDEKGTNARALAKP